MSSSPLTKINSSALSPVSALSIRKQPNDKPLQTLSKQAIELQNTLNKLKDAQSKKKLSNSNLIITSISNPVSSPQKNKATDDSEIAKEYKSLFKDIDTPSGLINEQKTYSKLNINEAEQAYAERRQQIKSHIEKSKSKSKIQTKLKNTKTVSEKKGTNKISQIDLSKHQKLNVLQQNQPHKPHLIDKLQGMKTQLKLDIEKLDKQIQNENKIQSTFNYKCKGIELYQQGLILEDKKQFKQKVYQREKILKEMEECTFQPQIHQPKSLHNLSEYKKYPQSRLQQQCKSYRDPQSKNSQRLSRSQSQENINNSVSQNNDINQYISRIQDKYQAIVNKANAIKMKIL